MTDNEAPSVDMKTLNSLMIKIEEQLKQIPSEQIEALKAAEMLLMAVNYYAEWVAALKKELEKSMKVIEAQNKTLKAKFNSKRILTPHV